MATSLICLKHRYGDDWLPGHDSQQFYQQVTQKLEQLQAFRPVLPRILLLEPDPLSFLSSFLAACIAQCPVFLGNPNWVETECQQAIDLIKPNLIWGSEDYSLPSPLPHSPTLPLPHPPTPPLLHSLILIPTGGSSGTLRFVAHTWDTLCASVQGFQQYFQQERINSCCVLPLYHVSGLMQFMRSFTTGGQLVILPFKTLEESCKLSDPHSFFISLVPTQLQRLLTRSDRVDWLSRFEAVLLGGAPAWDHLLTTARRVGIPLAPTYGMTETASQIATLKPSAFLAGQDHCGQVLPHARIKICAPDGENLGANQVGKVTIAAHSLMLGYYPTLDRPTTFQPDDLGFLDTQGNLHLVGRASQKIITGGENVFPGEVEAAILATGLVADVGVIGLPDPHWGESVTAVYVPQDETIAAAMIQQAIGPYLSKFKQPKQWVAVSALPRNAQGKLNYPQLKHLALTHLGSTPPASIPSPPINPAEFG